LKIYGNENESTKHYGKETVQAKASPTFMLYNRGAFVTKWSGINEKRFTDTLNEHVGLPLF